MRRRLPKPNLESHNNSQHVLAIVGQCSKETRKATMEAFEKTSDLPCDSWSDTSGAITLASNYPECILESENYCVLSAGFPYRFATAFGANTQRTKTNNDASRAERNKKSFSRTLLEFCESYSPTSRDHKRETDFLFEEIGRRLKLVSGHFSVYLVKKVGGKSDGTDVQVGIWNDPFGFMPVYHCKLGNDDHPGIQPQVTMFSTHWDCLVPALPSVDLNWDIVAEYLTLGTTLGGGSNPDIPAVDNVHFDFTMVDRIRNAKPGTSTFIHVDRGNMQLKTAQYTEFYGACETMTLPRVPTTDDSLISFQANPPMPRKIPKSMIPRGVHIDTKLQHDQESTEETASFQTSPEMADLLPKTVMKDGTLMNELFGAIYGCIEEALAQGFVTRAALTGGGDTRLLLACLLLRQKTGSIVDPVTGESLVFQTHSKQKTDLQIARHLGLIYGLEHKQIAVSSTTVEGYSKLTLGRSEVKLSLLHDQTPLRRKQRQRHERYRERIMAQTFHGRFGTEFLGFLCYNKSPVDVRTMVELDQFEPLATKVFNLMFRKTNTARNPCATLRERFSGLTQSQKDFASRVQAQSLENDGDVKAEFDAAYAFQLQLYTRAGLSDIYKGLCGGSWFSIPVAQFTRNAITPFLDNHLLQLLLCRVPAQDKDEPYQLYGQLYRTIVPKELLQVPSNNKILCQHSQIPRALKAQEAPSLPYGPKLVSKEQSRPSVCLRESNVTINESILNYLGEHLNQNFLSGAIAIIQSPNQKPTIKPEIVAKRIRDDERSVVRVLLKEMEETGCDSDHLAQICLRLQSFLLWYERRLLPHQRFTTEAR